MTENIGNIKQMVQLIYGATRTNLLHGAVNMDIFDHLTDNPMDSTKLAKITNTREEFLYRFLRSLCSIGVLTENKGHIFSVTELGSLLSSKSKYCLKNYLKVVNNKIVNQPLQEVETCLRTGENAFYSLFGTTFFDYIVNSPFGETFDRAMKDIGHICSMMSTYDYSGFKHIVDIGGGNGYFLLSILQRFPNCKGTLFDLAPTIENAKVEIAKSEVQDRITAEAGDYMKSIPRGGDCYILRQVFFSLSDEKAVALLSNIRKQLNDDCKLLIMEQVNCDSNDIILRAELDMIVFTGQGGKTRTKEQFEELGAKASFKMLRCVEIKDCGEIIVEFVTV